MGEDEESERQRPGGDGPTDPGREPPDLTDAAADADTGTPQPDPEADADAQFEPL